MTETLREIAETAKVLHYAEPHTKPTELRCYECSMTWPCDAAQLAAGVLAAPSPTLTREALAAALHHGCCSDSMWRMVQFRWLPAESCREYHLQTAERTLAALSETISR